MQAWHAKAAVLSLCICVEAVAFSQAPATFNDVVQQAAVAREQNDSPRAIDLYRRAVQMNPKWSQGWWFLGSLQYDAGSFAAARDSFTQFIALAPNPTPAFRLRGISELQTGEYAEALADLRQSLALGEAVDGPDGQRLRLYECEALTRLGKFDEALKSFRFLVQKGSTIPELPIAMGLAGLRMALLPKDVGDNQRDLLTSTGTAIALFMTGSGESASPAFDALFRRFPETPNLHCLYGTLWFPSDRDIALAEFRRELEIDPSNQRAEVLVAWALLLRNNAPEALRYAQKALESGSEVAAAQLVTGKSLVDIGRLDEGLGHLEHALRLEPGNLEIHIALAKAYSQSGRKQEAQRERSLSLKLAQNGMNLIALP